uniref:Putative coat protein n=1 Tax=Sichuan mosquito tymo-like virus TaxID=2864015 RepID=A0A8K1HHC6_9VIRU|nr:putative coat protein [Sichuan mosquito tymo-like virus]
MEALPEILANVLPAVIPAFTSSTNAQSGQVSSNDSERTTDNQLAVQRPVPNPTLPTAPTAHHGQQLQHGIVLPFQHFLHRHTGNHKFISLDVAAIPALTAATKFSRIAKLTELEIVIFPGQKALTLPATITACWTPNTVQPDMYSTVSVYGSQMVTFGGSYHVGAFVIPCDLSAMNPIIKSPLSYNDTPRLSLNCWLQTEATKISNTVSLADIYIRGKILCSHPALTIGEAPPQ